LAKRFKVSTHADGSYLEAHMKLRPVDFATDGVFLAGLAHHPKPLDETISQAEAAGCHAASALARGCLDVPGTISVIDKFLCRGCGRCVEACPYEAPQLTEVVPGVMVSDVNPALCKGCGSCSVVCPTGAAQVRHFKDEQIADMIEAALVEPAVEAPPAELFAERALEQVVAAPRREEFVEAEVPMIYADLRDMIRVSMTDQRLKDTLHRSVRDETVRYVEDPAVEEELTPVLDAHATEGEVEKVIEHGTKAGEVKVSTDTHSADLHGDKH
jgi:ferredoxin